MNRRYNLNDRRNILLHRKLEETRSLELEKERLKREEEGLNEVKRLGAERAERAERLKREERLKLEKEILKREEEEERLKREEERLELEEERLKREERLEKEILRQAEESAINEANSSPATDTVYDITVKCAFWNMLADGLSYGEFMCNGENDFDNDKEIITRWEYFDDKKNERVSIRKKQICDKMSELMKWSDILCTVENDRCFSILNHLRQQHKDKDIRCIYFIKKPGSGPPKLNLEETSAASLKFNRIHGVVDTKNNESRYWDEMYNDFNTFEEEFSCDNSENLKYKTELNDTMLSFKAMYNQTGKRERICRKPKTKGATEKEAQINGSTVKYYECEITDADNKYLSDDGIAIYYDYNKVSFENGTFNDIITEISDQKNDFINIFYSDIDFSSIINLVIDDTKPDIKYHSKLIDKNGNEISKKDRNKLSKKLNCFLPVEFTVYNQPLIIIGGHLDSGEQESNEDMRIMQMKSFLNYFNSTEHKNKQHLFLMDSNVSLQYINTINNEREMNKQSKLSQTFYDIYKKNGYENLIDEDIPNFKCLKMRHAKGLQKSKFGEFMYDTIDKCLYKNNRNFKIKPHSFGNYFIMDNHKLLNEVRNNNLLREQLKIFLIENEWGHNMTNNNTTGLSLSNIDHDKIKAMLLELYPNKNLPSDHPPIGVEILFYSRSNLETLNESNEETNFQWKQKYLKYKNKYLALKKRL